MRSTSSSERRTSRMSSTTAANASPIITKLESATASASNPLGSVDAGTSMAGSGMIDTAPMAVKWWLQIASVSSSGAADLPLLFVAVKTDRKCDRPEHRADHDRRRDQRRVPDFDAGDFESRHAGIVHCRDAAGDDGAADPWRRGASSESAKRTSPTPVKRMAATSDSAVKPIL